MTLLTNHAQGTASEKLRRSDFAQTIFYRSVSYCLQTARVRNSWILIYSTKRNSQIHLVHHLEVFCRLHINSIFSESKTEIQKVRHSPPLLKKEVPRGLHMCMQLMLWVQSATQIYIRAFHIVDALYHWRELPQVSFLSRERFCPDKHVFVATNMCLSHDKARLLSRQKYSCREKITFVATKQTCVLSPKAYFCRDCRDRSLLVATNVLLRQNYICRDKYLSWQKFCRNKNTRQSYFCCDKRRVLSRQKWYLWQLPPVIALSPVIHIGLYQGWCRLLPLSQHNYTDIEVGSGKESYTCAR